MSLLLKKTFAEKQLSGTKRTRVVAYNNKTFTQITEKRKEIDKMRIERIKEIGNTLDHIAKEEVKQSLDMLKEFFPFVETLKDKYTTVKSTEAKP